MRQYFNVNTSSVLFSKNQDVYQDVSTPFIKYKSSFMKNHIVCLGHITIVILIDACYVDNFYFFYNKQISSYYSILIIYNTGHFNILHPTSSSPLLQFHTICVMTLTYQPGLYQDFFFNTELTRIMYFFLNNQNF